MTAVAADLSSGDWAVGYSGGSPNATLVERWDGTRMAHVPSEDPSAPQRWLYAVGADGAGDAWTVVSTPSPAPNGNNLVGVASISSSEAWAVGFEIQADLFDTTLVERWDGTEWSIFPSPNHGGSNYSGLDAISAAPGATDLWAVGNWYDGNLTQHTLVEHYCA